MEKKIPKFLYEKLENQYGKEIKEKVIEGLLEEKPLTIRVNTLKAGIQEIKDKLDGEHINYNSVEWYDEAIIIENEKEQRIQDLDIYKNGEIYLQSLSSMIPAIVMEPKKDENILDMTSAPGGKTTQMCALSKNEAMITACEKNKIRLERLKYNLEKQGAKRVNVMMEDARKLDDYFSFDKILLDAPCSGSGTENIFTQNFTEELINRSRKTQEELLKKALKILKKGKIMVYSTCSILKEENEEILNNVLPKFNAKIVPIENIKQIPILPVTIEGTVCVCPSKLYEGFFVAKIIKE